MPDLDRTERIRRRAYRLWEEAGRPPHRADEFWQKAAEEVAVEEGNAVLDEARKDDESA